MSNQKLTFASRQAARYTSIFAIIYASYLLITDKSGYFGLSYFYYVLPFFGLTIALSFIKAENKSNKMRIVLTAVYIVISTFAVISSLWQFG